MSEIREDAKVAERPRCGPTCSDSSAESWLDPHKFFTMGLFWMSQNERMPDEQERGRTRLGERASGLRARAVEALLLHAGSSLLRAVEGVWFTYDLWFVRNLTPSEDIPMAGGAVGPPGLVSMVAMVLSGISTLYAALVLFLWAQAGAHQRRETGSDDQSILIAAIWAGTIALSALPAALIRGDVLDSAIAAFHVSYWEGATSICVLVADLALAAVATAHIRRVSRQPSV